MSSSSIRLDLAIVSEGLRSYKTGTPPDCLYFFEYPLSRYGPRPLLPGYWTLDEHGEDVLQVVDSQWDHDEHWWEIRMQLNDLIIAAHA